jgi:hypothetical protein
MAWANSTPGPGGRATPTVFEQQREELVREIAVVCYCLSIPVSLLISHSFSLGYGAGASEYE